MDSSDALSRSCYREWRLINIIRVMYAVIPVGKFKAALMPGGSLYFQIHKIRIVNIPKYPYSDSDSPPR